MTEEKKVFPIKVKIAASLIAINGIIGVFFSAITYLSFNTQPSGLWFLLPSLTYFLLSFFLFQMRKWCWIISIILVPMINFLWFPLAVVACKWPSTECTIMNTLFLIITTNTFVVFILLLISRKNFFKIAE